jgi:hypothetical protein
MTTQQNEDLSSVDEVISDDTLPTDLRIKSRFDNVTDDELDEQVLMHLDNFESKSNE